jgi:hypothetical protein
MGWNREQNHKKEHETENKIIKKNRNIYFQCRYRIGISIIRKRERCAKKLNVFPFSLRLAPSISVMIYSRSPGKISLRTPGHFCPDFLTVYFTYCRPFHFDFPVIFLITISWPTCVTDTRYTFLKAKINSEHLDGITGCPEHLVRNVFVPYFYAHAEITIPLLWKDNIKFFIFTRIYFLFRWIQLLRVM